MAVLIDPPSWPAHGRRWSHLVSDVSLAELHAFAAALGIPWRGFEGDHYDLPEERYADAVAAGAMPVGGGELVRRLRASGLRVPKRRGERVLASRVQDGERIDLLRSTLPPLAPVRRVHLLAVHAGQVLVVDHPAGPALPTSAPVTAGESGHDVARALLAGLGLTGEPVQIGYRRGTPLAAGGTAWSEPVLRCRVTGEGSGSRRWLPAVAAAVLAGDLGPLVAAEPA